MGKEARKVRRMKGRESKREQRAGRGKEEEGERKKERKRREGNWRGYLCRMANNNVRISAFCFWSKDTELAGKCVQDIFTLCQVVRAQ